MKTCNTCGKDKPLDKFEFLKTKNCHRNKCKSCRSEYLRQWRLRNKAKTLSYSKAKHERYKNDKQYVVARRCRARIWEALGRGKYKKTHKTFDLVGLSVEDLVVYLESKFQDGMTWENYGSDWHIDHIRPCASFDLTDPSQLAECFHYTNLQPLWAYDNLSKGARWADSCDP